MKRDLLNYVLKGPRQERGSHPQHQTNVPLGFLFLLPILRIVLTRTVAKETLSLLVPIQQKIKTIKISSSITNRQDSL